MQVPNQSLLPGVQLSQVLHITGRQEGLRLRKNNGVPRIVHADLRIQNKLVTSDFGPTQGSFCSYHRDVNLPQSSTLSTILMIMGFRLSVISSIDSAVVAFHSMLTGVLA